MHLLANYPIPGTLTIHVPERHLEEFKLLVNKAMNCWPDASPAMKEFADTLLEGKPLQDYYTQTGKQRPE